MTSLEAFVSVKVENDPPLVFLHPTCFPALISLQRSNETDDVDVNISKPHSAVTRKVIAKQQQQGTTVGHFDPPASIQPSEQPPDVIWRGHFFLPGYCLGGMVKTSRHLRTTQPSGSQETASAKSFCWRLGGWPSDPKLGIRCFLLRMPILSRTRV